ncbi:MAG: DUF4336 domain-containing protein [Pseudomonadota bacterium]
MLQEFGPSIWLADGPEVSFFGFPYPTRMAVVRLANGDLWIWSPVALDASLEQGITALGPVRHIVSPNKIHHLFMPEWCERWPDARVYASPGLAKRKPEVRFDADLGDEPDSAWEGEIDQVVFRGSPALEEVVFFHRESSTAIVCDLIQRHDPDDHKGWRGFLMRADGLVGKDGSTPREWRLSFIRRTPAREARERLLSWNPKRLLIAHGECESTGAGQIIARVLDWM